MAFTVGMISGAGGSNADTVDGFHASQTPGANIIVPLNADGVLDLSATYVKSSVYSFRRVDLTGATSDYDLQLGEEAFYEWNTTVNLNCPLHIAVSGKLYELICIIPNRASYAIHMNLFPNNTGYASAFQRTTIFPDGNNSSVLNWKDTRNIILYEQIGGGGMLVSLLQTTTGSKNEMHRMILLSNQPMQGAHKWNDTTTVWSSLGTLQIDSANGTIYILVRRLA